MYHILYHKNNFFFALFLNCAVDDDDDGVLVDDYPLKISIRQQKKKKKGHDYTNTFTIYKESSRQKKTILYTHT